MRRKWNRGFTTPELVIVIVVIVILAAVLIPTFIILANNQGKGGPSDPDVAADITLATNMNEVLRSSDTVPVSMSDLVVVLEGSGYRIDNLSPAKEGNVFLWNQTTNRISYIGSDGAVLYTEDVLPTVFTASPEFWLTVRSRAEMEEWENLSYYFAADITRPLTFTHASSINTGDYMAGDVTYAFEEEASVTVEGTLTSLTVNAPNATVSNYSSVSAVSLVNAAEDAYHEYGYVRGTLALADSLAGAVVIGQEGTVVEVDASQAAADAAIENQGYILSLTAGENATRVVNNGYIGNAADLGLENAASLTYTLSNASDLSRLRDKINNGIRMENVTYLLTSDIDLAGAEWIPMGPETNPFTGTFDGQGHTINGLSNLSLFGYVGAGTTVRDLTFTNVSTILPPVAACVYGSVTAPTTFSNIQVNGVISSDVISVSGLVGILRSTETELPASMKQSPEVIIENCTNNASASCVGYTRAAGFVVTVYGVNLVVRDCVNNGDLSVTNYTREAHAGGIVGFIMHNSDIENGATANRNNFTVTIENCTNNGAVSGTVGMSAGNYVGGIVGASTNGRLEIVGCTNSGNVASRNSAGGSETNAGGIIGRACGNTRIVDCDVTGSVSATAERTGTTVYAGGVVGYYHPAVSGGISLEEVLVAGNVTANGQGKSACVAGGLVGYNNNRNNRVTVTECTVGANVAVTAGGAEENCAALVAGQSASGTLMIASVTVAEGGTLVYGSENASLGLTQTPVEGGYIRYEGVAE